jgi:hypothetical protein
MAGEGMPQLSPVWREPSWVLLEDYAFDWIVVPAGFIFDGASVPRFFWRVVTPHSPLVIRAALGHDYGYTTRKKPREWLDNWFREVLIEDGVNALTAAAMYRAVRLFGDRAYHAER